MADQELDQQFVENQRERLVGLRDELVRIREGMVDDERTSPRPRGRLRSTLATLARICSPARWTPP